MTIADVPGRRPVLATTTRYSGHIWTVRTDAVQLADGPAVERDRIVHPGAVGVMALGADSRVLLVQQYRHPPGATLWEPPAGLLDQPGEDPLDAARRELYEEAHHRAAHWRVLVDAFTTPGSSDEAVRIYLARGLEPVPDADRHAGEHEERDMPVAWVPLDEVVAGVLAGRLHNPLLVMGSLALRVAMDGPGLDALRPGDAPWPERPSRNDHGVLATESKFF